MTCELKETLFRLFCGSSSIYWWT